MVSHHFLIWSTSPRMVGIWMHTFPGYDDGSNEPSIYDRGLSKHHESVNGASIKRCVGRGRRGACMLRWLQESSD